MIILFSSSVHIGVAVSGRGVKCFTTFTSASRCPFYRSGTGSDSSICEVIVCDRRAQRPMQEGSSRGKIRRAVGLRGVMR